MDADYVAWWRQQVAINKEKEQNGVNIPKNKKSA